VTSTSLDKAARALGLAWSIHGGLTPGEPYQVSLTGGKWNLREDWRAVSCEKAIEKALASIEAWVKSGGRGDVRNDLQPRFKKGAA
jgi:hypothetical protein